MVIYIYYTSVGFFKFMQFFGQLFGLKLRKNRIKKEETHKSEQTQEIKSTITEHPSKIVQSTKKGSLRKQLVKFYCSTFF